MENPLQTGLIYWLPPTSSPGAWQPALSVWDSLTWSGLARAVQLTPGTNTSTSHGFVEPNTGNEQAADWLQSLHTSSPTGSTQADTTCPSTYSPMSILCSPTSQAGTIPPPLCVHPLPTTAAAQQPLHSPSVARFLCLHELGSSRMCCATAEELSIPWPGLPENLTLFQSLPFCVPGVSSQKPALRLFPASRPPVTTGSLDEGHALAQAKARLALASPNSRHSLWANI